MINHADDDCPVRDEEPERSPARQIVYGFFANDTEELYANLSRVHCLLRRAVKAQRDEPQTAAFDVGRFLAGPPVDALVSSYVPSVEDERFFHTMAELRETCASLAASSLEHGIEVRVEHLRRRFGLSPTEIELCLL